MDTAIKEQVRNQAGVEINVAERFSWDTEVKHDLDGVEKQFAYLDILCDYASGDLIMGKGIEKLEFVPVSNLNNYDVVPPSVSVFKKLGWM